MGLSTLVAGVTGITMLTGVTLLAAPPTASAAVTTGHGQLVKPAQQYDGNPDNNVGDWLGSYVVGGKQVYCVRFALSAPDSNATYTPDGPLTDKWGNALPADKLAEVSYLLLRYGNTTDNDQSAALAHILHNITANGSNTGPHATAAQIAYDAPTHLRELSAKAQSDVTAMTADAAANQGPWDASVVAPTAPQIIGTSDKWTIKVVHSGTDKAVTGVPVKLTVTDGTVASDTVTTPADGSPLVVSVTPTGPKPTVKIDLSAPADTPTVQKPTVHPELFQWTVTTGGEKPVSSSGTTTATTAPGSVKVTKVDSTTQAGIAGAQLRVTGSDKATAAVKQDGTPLNGTDGKPLVVTTGADGTATVDGLRTPQDICLIEIAAPTGYDQNYNASAPPTVCGSVRAGQVLALSLTNTPNKPAVPIHIAAGNAPMTADAAVVTEVNPGGLAGLGAAVLIALGGVGYVLRRRRLARG
jgi:Prealbumin-like fold domain